ncbi:MAG: hypothetical protein ACWGMZ_03135 [Thermoguttaceae bacterium]
MKTAYARLTPWQARGTLALCILATLFCVATSMSSLWQGKADKPPRETNDVELYWAEVNRIHQGEGYYQAAAEELPSRGYPTQSVFNWRTPLPMWMLGHLPLLPLGKYLLGALALAVIISTFVALTREKDYSLCAALLCVILLSGPLLFTVLGVLFVMPVLWVGVLIAFSLMAYGIGRPLLGCALGLGALSMRELALPYCLLCACMSWQRSRANNHSEAAGASLSPDAGTTGTTLSICSSKRRRFPVSWEFIAWMIGISVWMTYFLWHWQHISGLIGPDALTHKHGWVRFGGAGFVLATAQMNAYLLLLPPWVTALYFAAALLGLAGWNTALGTRVGLTTCLYVVFFAIVGQDFNQYWGSVLSPLLCFGVARAPWSLRDIFRAAGKSSAIAHEIDFRQVCQNH